MLSERSELAEEPTALERAAAERRARGEPVLDLTRTDPGFARDEGAIRAALAAGGPADPRPAIAQSMEEGGVSLAPEAIVPCAGREDAWARLVWALTDRGDELLVPQPRGPHLARIAHDLEVALAPYPLRLDEAWSVDPAAIWEAIGERTRAIVVESPSETAGCRLRGEALEALAALEVPLIIDEWWATPAGAGARREGGAPVFVIGGASALPEAQIAWIAVSGPDALVRDVTARLARARPPIAAPMARALPALLELEPRQAVRERAARNLATLRSALAGSALWLPEVEGGWHAALRLAAGASEEALALRLLERGVLVSPGARYDFPDGEAWLVLSLLVPPDELARGAAALVELAG